MWSMCNACVCMAFPGTSPALLMYERRDTGIHINTMLEPWNSLLHVNALMLTYGPLQPTTLACLSLPPQPTLALACPTLGCHLSLPS